MAYQAKRYIDSLTATGLISFTTKKMIKEMGITQKAAERAIERLRHNKEIATPAKGYYLIITPEFRQLACLPPNYFVDDLMSYLNKSYYIALLSAGMFYGAAHQQPQMCQIMIESKRPNITCGKINIEFIQNKEIYKTPIENLKTRTGVMKVSSPEATAMDMIKFMKQSGGMSRIITVLDELSESMSREKLSELTHIFPERIWMQRLGYLLDKLGHKDLSHPLHEHLQTLKIRTIPLVPYATSIDVQKDKKWRIAINVDIESDLNDIY